MRFLLKVFSLFFLSSCFNTELFKEKMFFKNLVEYEENFDNEAKFKKYWSNGSQNITYINYFLDSSYVRLKTKRGSDERVKIMFNKTNLSFGTFKWRVYVPRMKIYENCSIGAFLYSDNQHELDFEIGSGNREDREKYQALDDELLLFCSSQNNPHVSNVIKIKSSQWYELELVLDRGEKNKYYVQWLLNNSLIQEVQLSYGRTHKFEAYCSLENIHFIGDKATTQENYVLFDYFKFESLK